jgi:hypothetical protein
MRQVTTSINNMSNLSAKVKLKELQDEINEGLREENKLSEHDLDLL